MNMSWVEEVCKEKTVVLIQALSARALAEGEEPKSRVGVAYEWAVNKKTQLPYVRMLVTHERSEETGRLEELEEPKFRTIASERAEGFTYRRMPHLPWVDPTEHMKGGGK